MLIHTIKGIKTLEENINYEKRWQRSMSQESENVSDLFPADNIRENAECHHAEHHGNEIDCLGVKAYRDDIGLIVVEKFSILMRL